MIFSSVKKMFREKLGFKKASEDWQWEKYMMLSKDGKWYFWAIFPCGNLLYKIHSSDYILGRLSISEKLDNLVALTSPLLMGHTVCTKRTIMLNSMYIEYDIFEDTNKITDKLCKINPSFGIKKLYGASYEVSIKDRLSLLSQGVNIIDWKVL